MEREEKKVEREIKILAKQATMLLCRPSSFSRRIWRQVRATKARLYEGRAQMNSVNMQLQQQLALIKVSGCMKKSAEVMAAVGKLVKIPELQQTMTDLAREMERAGLVEEIVTEGLEALDGDSVESDAALEVDRVVAELTAGLLVGAVDAPTGVPQQEVQQQEVGTEEDTGEMEEMKARLQSL
ncbi:unnamed protein product [Phaeothamnion confervicola]